MSKVHANYFEICNILETQQRTKAKHRQDLHTENCKHWFKIEGGESKLIETSSQIARLKSVKMSVINILYIYLTQSNKISASYFIAIDEVVLTFM